MTTANWTVPINYPGNVSDVVGQVIGPNLADEHYIVTEANYRPDLDMTECQAGLMAKGTESHVSVENQVNYTLLRINRTTTMLGHNPMRDLLPAAFRKPHASKVQVHHRPNPMMPGRMGEQMVLNGV